MPPAAATSTTAFRVHAFDVLQEFSNHAEAAGLLRRVVAVMNKVLPQKGWAVMRVSEFYPAAAPRSGPSAGGGRGRRPPRAPPAPTTHSGSVLLGLNINRGEHIKLRLRPPHDQLALLPFEEVMCTAAHEMVHNAIGPHNEAFFELYRHIVQLCEDVLSADAAAAGAATSSSTASSIASVPRDAVVAFQGAGRRLGGRDFGPLREAVTTAAVLRQSLLTWMMPPDATARSCGCAGDAAGDPTTALASRRSAGVESVEVVDDLRRSRKRPRRETENGRGENMSDSTAPSSVIDVDRLSQVTARSDHVAVVVE